MISPTHISQAKMLSNMWCSFLKTTICFLIFISLIQLRLSQIYDENDEVILEEVSMDGEEGFSYAESIDDDLTSSKDAQFGHLTGDVQNWAAIIQNYILQVIQVFSCYLKKNE